MLEIRPSLKPEDPPDTHSLLYLGEEVGIIFNKRAVEKLYENLRYPAKEYVKHALRTESTKEVDMHSVSEGKYCRLDERVAHAVWGLVTEAGEMLDHLKKVVFYGKEFDRTNLIEEAGDVFWYLAILSSALKTSFEEIWEKNIAKLTARYPEKFTSHHALNRDLDAERKTLET